MSASAYVAPARGRRETLLHQARILRVIAGSEFKLKYAESVLGYVWSLIKPLAIFSVLYFVFGRFFRLEVGIEHYPLYLLLGIVLFTYFSDATSLAMHSIVTRGALLRKLAFPRLVIPVSVTATAALTFGVNLLAVGAFVAWNAIAPSARWLLIAPLLLELYAFVLGVSLILATLFVRFRDIGQVWELGVQLLFYASPIIYPLGFLPPWAKPILVANPFVQVVQDLREIVIGLPPRETVSFVYGSSAGRLIPIAVALAVLLVGVVVFRREEPWFAERV